MNNKRKSEIKTHLSEGDERYKLVKPANLKSKVWHNFDLIQFDGKLEDYACCKKCKDVLTYSKKTGTGSLIRHNCDNQNSRRNISSNHSKQQSLATPKKVKYAAARQATIDPLDCVPSGTTPEDLYEQSGGVSGVDSKKRNYDEAFDDTSSASVQHSSNPDLDGNDSVHGEYVDIPYQIKPDPNKGDGDIDDDMDDSVDDEDDDQSHCNGEDVTTSNFNLIELLMKSNEGQNALSYYDLHNRLNVKHREVVFNTLINIINSSSECRKYNENLKRISCELRQLFPMENYSTLELHKYSMRYEMGETPQQEDLKLYNLLNSWSLTHLYDHFRAENITFDAVKFMKTKHIDRLFKNLTIGDNIFFDHHFKKWLDNGSPEPFIDLNLKPQRKVLSTSQNRSRVYAKVNNKCGQDRKELQTMSVNEELDTEEDHVDKTVIDIKQRQQQQTKQKRTTTRKGTSRYVRTSDRASFDVETILRAVRAIHFKIHTVAGAARVFQIPRSTLQRYMNRLSIYQDLSELNDEQLIDIIKGYSYTACAVGRVFSDVEEQALVSYIKNCCDHYQALSINEFRDFAYRFAKENDLIYPANWDQEKCAGKSWCYGFMRRHRKLCLRKTEQKILNRQGNLLKLDPELDEL